MEFKMLRFVVEDAVAVITLDYAPTLNKKMTLPKLWY